MAPNTAQKLSTSTLKFLVDYVYAGRLKRPPSLPHPWRPPLPVQPPRPRPWPLLLALDSLVLSDTWVIVASLPSPPFLPESGDAVSISGVILI